MVAQVSMSSSWLLYLSSVSDEAGDSISKYCALDPAAAFERALWGKDGFGTCGAGLVGGGTGAWILAGQGDVPVDTAPPGGPVGTPVARVPGADRWDGPAGLGGALAGKPDFGVVCVCGCDVHAVRGISAALVARASTGPGCLGKGDPRGGPEVGGVSSSSSLVQNSACISAMMSLASPPGSSALGKLLRSS